MLVGCALNDKHQVSLAHARYQCCFSDQFSYKLRPCRARMFIKEKRSELQNDQANFVSTEPKLNSDISNSIPHKLWQCDPLYKLMSLLMEERFKNFSLIYWKRRLVYNKTDFSRYFKNSQLEPNFVKLCSLYNDNRIKIEGEKLVTVEAGDQCAKLPIIAVKGEGSHCLAVPGFKK